MAKSYSLQTKVTSVLLVPLLIVAFFLVEKQVHGGVIGDIYNKFTGTNNKTVKQSVPICGSGIFSTPDQASVSPELIFVTNRLSKLKNRKSYGLSPSSSSESRSLSNIAREYKFNVDNVTIEELEQYGFNREAPVTFLIHGFTSGYPLQAWMTAIVESYAYDREAAAQDDTSQDYGASSNSNDQDLSNNGRESSRREELDLLLAPTRRKAQQKRERRYKNRLQHNLFIVNWNYAARGILYPRAVANIPVVASYVTRFINDHLIEQAGVDAAQIQLIGHSLGAHLAGFVGKNTRSKVGRIYALDPAGPCFGTLTGSLYPSSKRLAPDDATEVVSVHTNSALLGIDKPLGRYSVFVEGGRAQPGCPGDNGVIDTISSFTWDSNKFEEVACSHARAPNLLSHRHDHSDDPSDNCQLVAYACSDWKTFTKGQCGLCKHTFGNDDDDGSYSESNYREDPEETRDRGSAPPPVNCILVGLDWQYPELKQNTWTNGSPARRTNSSTDLRDKYPYDRRNYTGYPDRSTTRRPAWDSSIDDDTSNLNSNRNYSSLSYPRLKPSTNLRRKRFLASDSLSSRRRNSTTSTDSESDSSYSRRKLSGREEDDSSRVKPTNMFLRTSDTQPYCTYHYQLVLELNEPFDDEPSMSIVLQELTGQNDASQRSSSSRSSTSERRYKRIRNDRLPSSEQNTLSADNFGFKYDDRTYTHLLTSARKLKRVDRATMIFNIEGGTRTSNKLARNIKRLHVNYMSHANEIVRRRSSARLCPMSGSESSTSADQNNRQAPGNRVYLAPCKQNTGSRPNNNDDDDEDYENDRRNNNNNNSGLLRDTTKQPDSSRRAEYARRMEADREKMMRESLDLRSP